ncbi:MAG: ABC transporter [Dictyoglomus sp. NZ13-RE01]|nr:MAG: ABC transporter [Dictyoglomus sp. NZ13-RE01]
MKVIEVKNLTKIYRTYEDINLRKLFQKNLKEIKALDNVSFSINSNEFVGLIGVNGAGKSTLIKILTGILEPTYGEVRVLGNVPTKYRKVNNYRISAVFGQRCQLRWDISAIESFKLLKEIYRINDKDFISRLEFFSELLDISEIMNRPVRTLSLGEKMRVELCAAFLHNPEIVFLDEPTIGLDIFSKEAILNFLKELKKENKVTLILTTHDISDIEEVCERILILDKGKIIIDGQKNEIINSFNIQSQILFIMKKEDIVVPEIVKRFSYQISKNRLLINEVPKNYVSQIITEILRENFVVEMEIKYQDLEEIVKQIYIKEKGNIS